MWVYNKLKWLVKIEYVVTFHKLKNTYVDRKSLGDFRRFIEDRMLFSRRFLKIERIFFRRYKPDNQCHNDVISSLRQLVRYLKKMSENKGFSDQ